MSEGTDVQEDIIREEDVPGAKVLYMDYGSLSLGSSVVHSFAHGGRRR